MFEKLTKAFEPFGLCVIVIAGLTLVGTVANRGPCYTRICHYICWSMWNCCSHH
jgi:hypothetical protein